MKLRLVVSCINSFPAIFSTSTWLNFKMKQLLHLIPSYVKFIISAPTSMLLHSTDEPSFRVVHSINTLSKNINCHSKSYSCIHCWLEPPVLCFLIWVGNFWQQILHFLGLEYRFPLTLQIIIWFNEKLHEMFKFKSSLLSLVMKTINNFACLSCQFIKETLGHIMCSEWQP